MNPSEENFQVEYQFNMDTALRVKVPESKETRFARELVSNPYFIQLTAYFLEYKTNPATTTMTPATEPMICL
jgi:hypothetical protein